MMGHLATSAAARSFGFAEVAALRMTARGEQQSLPTAGRPRRKRFGITSRGEGGRCRNGSKGEVGGARRKPLRLPRMAAAACEGWNISAATLTASRKCRDGSIPSGKAKETC